MRLKSEADELKAIVEASKAAARDDLATKQTLDEAIAAVKSELRSELEEVKKSKACVIL